MLSPLFASENPSLGIYSKQDGIHLRAIARAGTDEEARKLIEPMEAEIRRVSGHAIWGEDDDTAVSAALRALANRGLSLAVVEGFTGGLLSSTLMEHEASRNVLLGTVVLGPTGSGSRLLRDISGAFDSPAPEDAAALAAAACETFGADVGLSITGLVTRATDRSGPVGTTHVGIVSGDETHIRSAHYPTRRLRIRSRAATHSLLELARVVGTGAGGQEERWG